MAYSAGVILSLAAQCAPSVAPQTVAAIVRTESGGHELALNVNGLNGRVRRPSTVTEAVATARAYVAKGYSVDMGLAQINSRNMRRLGLSWDNVFDPCTNLAASAAVLSGNYHSVRAGLHPQRALRIALSMYNTGSQSRGFRNGYVGKVVGNAGQRVAAAPAAIYRASTAASPVALAATPIASQLAELVAENSSQPSRPPATPPSPPSWDVFAKAAYQRARSAEKGVVR